MPSKPPSLGIESSTPYKKVQELFDLPNGRPNIVSQISKILDLGGVQRVVIELGQPIKVDRLVTTDDVAETPVQDGDDLLNAARNGEMFDLPKKTKNPYQYLFQAFYVLTQKRLKPSVLLVHDVSELRKCLLLDTFLDLPEIFGIEIKPDPGIPDLTALLIATDVDNPQAAMFSLRLDLDWSDQ